MAGGAVASRLVASGTVVSETLMSGLMASEALASETAAGSGVRLWRAGKGAAVSGAMAAKVWLQRWW